MKKIIAITLAIGLLVIGIHQSMRNGIANSYWIFMFSVGFLFLYQYFNKFVPEKEPEEETEENGVKSRRKADQPETKKRSRRRRIK